MKRKTKVLLCATVVFILCIGAMLVKYIHTDKKGSIPQTAELVYEESVSPNKDYVTDEKDIVNYIILVYQTKDDDIIVKAESNSAFFEDVQYQVSYGQTVNAEDIQIKWTTLSGSTEATEGDQLGLAQVSISKDGEIISEKVVSFVSKGVKAVTDVLS